MQQLLRENRRGLVAVAIGGADRAVVVMIVNPIAAQSRAALTAAADVLRTAVPYTGDER